MERSGIETTVVSVPCDEGHIIGNILRQYATRSVGSWQVIGYKIDSTAQNFGFSNGSLVSYLDLLHGYVVCKSDVTVVGNVAPKLCEFTWNGSYFTSDEFELHGLNHAIGDRIVACLNYAHGHRNADQNREVLRLAVPGPKEFSTGNTLGNAQGFYAVPSAHTKVSTFKYRVNPIDEHVEELTIEADAGVVQKALSQAIRSLSDLGI